MTTTSSTSSVPEAAVTTDWAELRSRLHAFVAGRVRNDAATRDDLVQEILLRLHRGLPKLRQSERLDAFAYQIARNAIADHYRKARPEQPVSPETLDDHTEAGEALEEDGAARAQIARCLRPVVDQLRDDYRDALLLTDLGDLSQAEAARRLGLSEPGMRSRVQRGRAQLHEELGKCCSVELDAASQIDEVERVGPCACD